MAKTPGKITPSKKISASERVYNHLRDNMHRGIILPGAAIDLSKVSATLKISSTPLRDALIRLEAEGFVTIYPRSKVLVNVLELSDFHYLYTVIGALEYTLILNALDRYTPAVIGKMKQLNREMEAAIDDNNMQAYDQTHFAFHEIFLELEPNTFAQRILKTIKNRLWDFPRKNFLTGWYYQAIEEHDFIIGAIERRDEKNLAHFVKDVHWGYPCCKDFIKKEYNLE
ncbi:MAG: GntR family transcriptional regulator [Desulfobacterales bacterium]|nr:GntR family transcriptional regulator [Desulfobacterales bacterium]